LQFSQNWTFGKLSAIALLAFVPGEADKRCCCGVTRMKSTLTAVILAASLVVPIAGQSDTGRDGLLRRDAPPVNRIPGGELRGLFFFGEHAAPKQEIPPLNYSKDWLDALPKPEGDAQWACLSEALYFEARGETVKGQFAVAEVILNRVESDHFPDTACGVIRQGTGRKYQCQFTYTCDGYKEVIAEKKAYERVSKVARAALDGTGDALTSGATHYHTTAVSPRWSRVFTKTARIGVHIFYRHNVRTASSE
jgi:Cell Wall Hydrolase